ncbi:MAG: precorrin-3B synthase [Nitrospirae bacterium]|nr:MAG: precorrin-3B synthase [Nitrospirota bacterium]
MNKVELLKQEKDGLDVYRDLVRYANLGWEAISEDDVQRLKWYGLFLRNPTPGFFMIRVRIPGGRATSAQIRTLAELATCFGNGLVDVTTRQQIQLRHLRIEHVPEAFARMEEVGLTSLQTGMDNVRNIMTCPVAGLSLTEMLDATPLVQALTQEIVGNRAYSNLPRKFNVAITGCVENCLHAETQDLALVPARQTQGGEQIYGFNVLVGGKLGSGGYRIATPLDVFVTPEEVIPVACAVMTAFRDYGFRDSRNTARLAFLLDEWGETRFRVEVERRLGRALPPAGEDLRKATVNTHMGIFRQKQSTFNYVGLHIPVGRMPADDLRELARLAESYGTGELRLTPHQAVIVPNVPDKHLGDLIEEPLLARYVYNPSPVRQGLVSCVGNDYCNLAVIETKSRALETAKALEQKVPADMKPITMHWSGCPSGCGNHLVADVGLLGKKVKIHGQIVDAVDVYVGGRSGPHAKIPIKLLEDVPCDRLADVLAGILPYHTREKMYRTKGKPRKNGASVPPRSAPRDERPGRGLEEGTMSQFPSPPAPLSTGQPTGGS